MLITLMLTAWLTTPPNIPDQSIFPGYAPIPSPSAADKLTPLSNQGVESTFKTFPCIIKTA